MPTPYTPLPAPQAADHQAAETLFEALEKTESTTLRESLIRAADDATMCGIVQLIAAELAHEPTGADWWQQVKRWRHLALVLEEVTCHLRYTADRRRSAQEALQLINGGAA